MATISKLSNPNPTASLPSSLKPKSSITHKCFLGFQAKPGFNSKLASCSCISFTSNHPSKGPSVVRCSVGDGNGTTVKRTTLHDLYEKEGQSPWYDNLCRRVTDLLPLIENGVSVTSSNPAIFEKAISSSNAYNDQFRTFKMPTNFLSQYGGDGYVSVEVSPRLAEDTEMTIEAAKLLHKAVDRPNVYIKIPATAPCIPSIKDVIAKGIRVNVTLIFSLARYEAVIDACLDGLEASGLSDLSRVTSVTFFFVSRAAVAQAALAYQLYQKKFSGPRWEALVKMGAKKQRLLWASTSVKNPAYPDTLYVDPLIGPDTVSTMPDQALQAFIDHGTVSRTVDAKVSEAEGIYSTLEKLGIDWAYVGSQLDEEGVESFKKSFDSLLDTLQEKANSLKLVSM
ncbi:Detected protein of confused Function [Hibiscus syriacus]|uniref:Detected protein of confused Function n=1 Tax=Hibiscus syriacus TaxID=106335 RepID=A0A6A2ZHG1_HIBSY|nr:Detected protein of confused Function [Hibiscus syriacus]